MKDLKQKFAYGLVTLSFVAVSLTMINRASARLYNPLSIVGSLTVTDLTATNVTTTNLNVTNQLSFAASGFTLENFIVRNLANTQNTTITANYIAIATNTASTGVLRLGNAVDINARNAANTGDLRLIGTNSSNQTLIGNTTGASLFGSDVGFSTDNTYDIGGGTRNPRHINAEGTINVNTNTFGSASLVVQGSGTLNPFLIVTNTAAATAMFTILTNGNVGINSTTPLSTFSVQGIAGSNPLDIASSTGASLLSILQNGNVGILTKTPLGDLQIGNTVDAQGLLAITASTGGTSDIFFDTTAQNRGVIRYSHSGVAAPSADSMAFWTAGSERLRIDAFGRFGFNTTSQTALVNIFATATGTPSLNIASSTGASMLQVAASGDVMLGGSTDSAILNLVSSAGGIEIYGQGESGFNMYTDDSLLFRIDNDGDSNESLSILNGSGATIFNIDESTTAFGFNTTSANAFITVQPTASGNDILSIVSSSPGSASVLKVTSGGSIGVNSSSPIAQLAIQGTPSLNPFAILSSTAASMFSVNTLGYVKGNFIKTGSITTFTVSSTATAAQLCDSTALISEPSVPGTLTLTLPSSSTLFSTCLTNIGDQLSVRLFNYSATADFSIVVGTGGTIHKGTDLGATESSVLTITRVSSTYRAHYPVGIATP